MLRSPADPEHDTDASKGINIQASGRKRNACGNFSCKYILQLSSSFQSPVFSVNMVLTSILYNLLLLFYQRMLLGNFAKISNIALKSCQITGSFGFMRKFYNNNVSYVEN